jgi:hypothetical protein
VRFREAAREIVDKDRRDRKRGPPVDTEGAIARAMERAFRQGFLDAQGDLSKPMEDEAPPGEACLVVSARGCVTWWHFLKRGGEFPEDLTQV